ncbi:MAG: hypothetical protein AAF846_12285 [Chloroflexota bacterium]
METNTPKVLMIAGMHRSGTSLTANWLQSCGLFIGDNLLETRSKYSNPAGKHYEDVEFLSFHKALLKDNGYRDEGYLTDQKIKISNNHRSDAVKMIQARAENHSWGWKEPRSTLLIDFWDDLLPNMVMFGVYRHPMQVVDSIIRRDSQYPHWRKRLIKRIRNFPLNRAKSHYHRVWMRYNTQMINFFHNNPERAVILEINDLIEVSKPILVYLNNTLGFNLNIVSSQTVFIKERLTKKSTNQDDELQQSPVISQSMDVYQQLCEFRDQTLEKIANVSP